MNKDILINFLIVVTKNNEISLKVKRINLNQPELLMDFDFSSTENYLIPYQAYLNIIEHFILFPEDNNLLFWSKYLKIASLIIKREHLTTPRAHFLSISKDYYKHIKILGSTISRKPFSRANGRAFEYKFIPNKDFCYIGINNAKELEFINELPENHPCNNEKYISALTGSTINVCGAIDAEIEYIKSISKDNRLNINKLTSRINRIFAFLTTRSISIGNNVNRCYNAFSSLSNVSRQFVNIDGKYFKEIDLKSAQAVILIVLANRHNLLVDENYIQSTTKGVFYELIMEAAENDNINEEKIYDSKLKCQETFNFKMRNEVKELVYRSVFFCQKNINKSFCANIFSNLFPKAFKAISVLNKEGSLAKQLQDLEASIILNVIPNDFYFTVHDAIYSISDDEEIERIEREIENELIKLSGLQIKNVTFGDHKLKSKTLNNQVVTNIYSKPFETETYIINRKQKERIVKDNKYKSNKNNKENIIKEMLNNNLSKEEIMKILNINIAQYYRYKNRINQQNR